MSRKRSQADELVVAGQNGELFHDADTPYADIVAPEPVPHHEVLRVRSRAFRSWLSGVYWRTFQRPAGGQALTDAIDLLAALALFEGLDRRVGLRLAEHKGAIYLDLADDRWRVVEVDTAGWRILKRSPVPFRRPRGMLPLPEPVRGGSLEELRPFLNLDDDDDRYRLLGGWVVACFRPRGPYLVLVLTGEQDAAKSTTARFLRLLVDPNTVGDRSLPRDEQTLAIAASNSWVVSLDNVSAIQDWQSDALARLATGAGFSARQLYSDDEEVLIHVARPLIVNGIGSMVTRPDLMDRAIVVELPTIPEEARRTEDHLFAEFERVRPRLLGALLTAASVAFDGEDRVEIKRLPRMADATKWVTAAEGALRWPRHSFLAAYRANRSMSREITLEASPLAEPLSKVMEEHETWLGSATKLLEALEGKVDEAVRRRKDWPATANRLGVELRRLAPDLRKVGGIDASFGHGHRKLFQLVRVPKESAPSALSALDDARDGAGSVNSANSANDLHTRASQPLGNGAEELVWPIDAPDVDDFDTHGAEEAPPIHDGFREPVKVSATTSDAAAHAAGVLHIECVQPREHQLDWHRQGEGFVCPTCSAVPA
jgi:hypothetical protein